jgi:amino acid permease
MSSQYCKGQIGQKFYAFALLLIGIVFLTALLTMAIPLFPVPKEFLGWYLFFCLMLIFFFFYSIYEKLK